MSSHAEQPFGIHHTPKHTPDTPSHEPEEGKKKEGLSRRSLLTLGGIAGAIGVGGIGYLAGRGGEAPAPAPKPPEVAPPTETEEPTVEPTETQEPTVEAEPNTGELTRTYGGIETDQPREDLVRAMSFEKGMTPEEIAQRFIDGYNYTVMGGASGNLESIKEYLSGNVDYVTNEDLFNDAETRAKQSADAFTEAIFGKDWIMDNNSMKRQDFYDEMVYAAKDSNIRWAATFGDPANSEEYRRFYEPAGTEVTIEPGARVGDSEVISVLTKGHERVEGYVDPIDFESIHAEPLIEPLDSEIINGGKFRGFQITISREDNPEENRHGRPVITVFRFDDNVINL